VLFESKADLVIFGNAERALVDITRRIAAGENVKTIRDLRGTAFLVPHGWLPDEEWSVHNSTRVDVPGRIDPQPNPYAMALEDPKQCALDNAQPEPEVKPVVIMTREQRQAAAREKAQKTVVRLPSFETVSEDPVMYAHASRVFHLESNPGNARALVQQHGDRDVWLNAPPLPLAMDEMDGVYDLSYARAPHPSYGKAHIPAWEMIRYSVNIMRGCFGGCTFCSITEHEGRIIQSRSEPSILREIELIRDTTKNFAGTITDLGGPTANMYRLACKDKKIEESCRRLSCVYPTICSNLGTDHSKLISLYRKARAIPGIKKILIGSGLRYDLAVRSPEYVKELVTHHVGGLLKIAPEHTEEATLSKMMKPGIGAYDEFKALFDKYSKEAGKKQYLIPYFIAAHPGSTDEDMLNLALWLKKNNFHLDQVQTFTPTPMAMATTMYHSGKNPLHKVTEDSEDVITAKSGKTRKLHKAFLRYYDPENWPTLREGLKRMGRGDLIGNGERHLVPPAGAEQDAAPQRSGGRRPPAGPRNDAPKGRVIEVAPRRNGRGSERNERRGEPAPFMAPPSKAKAGILSTIKSKPKAGRK
jgi:uncharacterized radical SAM protein YgiQ